VIAVIEGEEWTEVRVVIFCYDSCLKGMSCRQIALALTRMGIPTQRGNKIWNRRTIRQILSNSNYTGEGYNGRYTKEEGVKNYPVKGTIKLPDCLR
jgi:site-specific DNA recombinase